MESTGEPSAKRPREDETAMTASRMAGGSGDGGQMGGVKKETPVTIPPSITHGFQNTHTTIVPYLNYFSVRNLNYSATNTSLRIRMNTPGSRPESYSAVVANATATGFSETLKSIDSDTVVSNFPIFPGPSNSYGGPAWGHWEVWKKIYQVYTVIKVHYKLTIHHPRSGSDNGALVITTEESSTSGDNGENTTILGGNLYQYLGLEHHKRHSVGPGTTDGSDAGGYTIIEGTYWPGKFKRNVINDSDVKTWIKTDATSDLVDNLWVGFFHDPLRASTRKQHVNCELEMKAVVQFKDLKEAFRYPAGQGTSIALTAPTDFRHYTLNSSDLFQSAVGAF